jgi:hypothetical protein
MALEMVCPELREIPSEWLVATTAPLERIMLPVTD